MNKFGNVMSLDFETTSTSPDSYLKSVKRGVVENKHKARIWSIGIATRDSGTEAIFKPSKEQLSSESDILSGNKFYAGSTEWASYVSGGKKATSDMLEFDATDRNVLKHMDDSFAFGKSGMVLVQNLGFERSFFSALEGSSDSKFIERLLEQSPDGNTKLYTPSSVTKAKAEAKDARTLQELDKAMDKVMAAYESVDASVAKYEAQRAAHGGLPKLYAADLMDFTKATFTKAVTQGHIPEIYSEMGHNVEFLSKLLLGEEEIHGALSDARQQIRIFDKLIGMRDEMIAGQISDETTGIFNKMKTASGTVREMQAMKSVLSNIEKFKESGKWDSKELVDTAAVPYINTLTGESGNIKVPRYNRNISNDRGFANFVAMINSRYSGTSAQKKLEEIISSAEGNIEVAQDLLRNEHAFANESLRVKGNAEIMNRVIAGEKVTTEELARLRQVNISQGTQRSIPQMAEDTYNKARSSNEILQSILPENHKVGIPAIGLAAAGGLLYLMGDSFDDDIRVKQLRERQERLNFKQYNDPTFNRFSALDYSMVIPAGYAEAQYSEARRAHEY